MSEPDQEAVRCLNHLKLCETVKDDGFVIDIITHFLKEARMGGGSGRTFISGYNAGLEAAA